MLLRLLLALTIALLPMQVVAACHGDKAAPKAAAHHGAHGEEAKAPLKKQAPPAEQLCCAAPAFARAPHFDPRLPFARSDAPGKVLHGAPLAATPPATPPPKPAA